jgi:hypothetical protein
MMWRVTGKSGDAAHVHLKRQRTEMAVTAGFELSSPNFLTAYADREDSEQTASNLAWDTQAWFVSESDNIIMPEGGGVTP